jgi:hypothetical protein
MRTLVIESVVEVAVDAAVEKAFGERAERGGPMKRITDPQFQYRPSYDTNVRETFERVRREQQLGECKKSAIPEAKLRVVKLERQAR